ncbi:Zinc finger, C3HC4 type (RING finger) domain-containing protein [Spironucleus salmonicida]|uniref:Zinc finger, C3HC4 type (RING finger) domain-containing protein n=1 Tax=Spironucleus salmonicida TaxID=348837 RepID=V6LC05_9EUKA|nr:Zinc finger, C3HC4 type (RING finger) domain-containing protein [Spironucleus salmonicida]|eukprot:EST41997.1 hypothetical protein SS50377_18302 [Spironucleus salmonicida]
MGNCLGNNIQKQKTQSYIQENVCPLCYENVQVDDYWQLDCSHLMHQYCYNELIQSNVNKCPICRQKINLLLESSSSESDIYNFEIDVETLIHILNILSIVEELTHDIEILQ